MNVHHYFSIFTISTAVVFNIILLYLIFRFSSDRIGNYKYFLFIYTLNAALYSFSQLGTLGNWIIPETGQSSYLFFSSVQIFSRDVQIWTITAFVGLFHMNLFIVSWCFLYRLTLFNQSTLFITKWKMALLGLLTAMMESLTIMDAWLIFPTPLTDELFDEKIFAMTGHPIQEVGYIGAPFKINGTVNAKIAVCLTINGGVNACVNIFVVYCWFGIRQKLAENNRSAIAHKIHYRLYILLTLQSLLPVIFNSTPVIIAIILSLFNINIGNYLLLCGDAMNIAQILDPICIVYFVNDYKRNVSKLVCGKILHRQINPSTAYSSSKESNLRTLTITENARSIS